MNVRMGPLLTRKQIADARKVSSKAKKLVGEFGSASQTNGEMDNRHEVHSTYIALLAYIAQLEEKQ